MISVGPGSPNAKGLSPVSEHRDPARADSTMEVRGNQEINRDEQAQHHRHTGQGGHRRCPKGPHEAGVMGGEGALANRKQTWPRLSFSHCAPTPGSLSLGTAVVWGMIIL